MSIKTVYTVISRHSLDDDEFVTVLEEGILGFTTDPMKALVLDDKDSADRLASAFEPEDVEVQAYIQDLAGASETPRVWMAHGESSCVFQGPKFEIGDGCVDQISPQVAFKFMAKGDHISLEDLALLWLDRERLLDAGLWSQGDA